MLRTDDFVKSQLLLLAYRYSQLYGQGGHLTTCAIMSVIANRNKKGWGNWLDIIDRVPTFAAEVDPPETVYPVVWEPSFTRCLHEVEAIYDGTMDYAKGGLYFCDLRHVETLFFKEKILGNLQDHPKVMDMNSFAIFA